MNQLVFLLAPLSLDWDNWFNILLTWHSVLSNLNPGVYRKQADREEQFISNFTALTNIYTMKICAEYLECWHL